MIYYIYMITCLVSGKKYIGKAKDPAARYRDHCKPRTNTALAHAFRKHGRENMRMEIIASCLSEADAFNAERALIVQHGTKRPHGYNLTDGGEGATGTIAGPETRAKISAANKGKIVSAETRARMSAFQKGRKKSPEQVAKLVAKLRGRKNPDARSQMMKIRHLANTPEARAKLSASLKGRKFTAEWRAKCVASFKEWAKENREFYIDLGRKNGDRLRGRRQTPEQVAKRVASRRATIIARAHVDVLIADQMRMI